MLRTRSCRMLCLAGLVALALPSSRVAHGQMGRTPAGPYGGGTYSRPGAQGDSNDMGLNAGDSPMYRQRVEIARKNLRKKRMVDDANRLLALTQQFQAATEGRGDLTDVDLKQLDEIARLAKTVKDEMRQ